ncbi:MAG: hypothetical protein O2927_06285, partial [Planctomycetota bacterium]|nr:hypothetical protein [Planctomycetota bacterium]
ETDAVAAAAVSRPGSAARVRGRRRSRPREETRIHGAPGVEVFIDNLSITEAPATGRFTLIATGPVVPAISSPRW